MTTQPKIAATSNTISTRQQPVPISRETFTANGKTYVILRFSEGLNLRQTLEATEGMKAEGLGRLTLQKAREIRNDPESNAAFLERLKPSEWTYVRDLKVESKSLAAYLVRGMSGSNLYVYDDGRPVSVSRVVVLEKTGSVAATAQAAPECLRLGEENQK